MPVIEGRLGISHAQAGFVFFATSLGYCIGLLASGFVSCRLNHRWTVVLSSATVGVALVGTGLGGGLGTLCLGMLFVGIAGGLYLPSGIATITSMVSPSSWGKAFAVHELAPNISFAAAPLLVEVSLGWLSWRGVLALLGLIALAGGAAFALSGRGGSLRGTPPSSAVVVKEDVAFFMPHLL